MFGGKVFEEQYNPYDDEETVEEFGDDHKKERI